MSYMYDLIDHVAAVKACGEQLGFRAAVGISNLALDIEKSGIHVRFQPRFVYLDEKRGGFNYTPYFRPGVLGFCGWLPYFNKVWPIALDKLAFKEFVRERGLRTPQWWTSSARDVTDFIVKAKSGSFGQGMRGPFRALDGSGEVQALRDGEFYERLIAGTIVKAWYWNAEPRCLELQPQPRLTGDGKRSIRELIVAYLGQADPKADRWMKYQVGFSQLFAWQGKTLDSVLAAGESVIASIRYASTLQQAHQDNRNVLAIHADAPLGQELRDIGETLRQAIPEELRQGVLFTVDGVLDDDGKLWLLEMNPNPTIHPDVYPAMMKSVLSLKVSEMPSFSENKDDPAFKGGLVWARPQLGPSASDRR
ncbi:MAG: hypothetical protein QOD26_2890 [Betaproteobacteria bacterium]|jgi:hypothetical protein|nr:hypothetical protein [Betaproteobacteria bacterium]